MEGIVIQEWAVNVGIVILSVIGGLNAFFIRNLIAKIDRADKSITRYEEQIKQLRENINQFSSFVKELSDLKSEVAVLKYALENKNK